MTKYNRYKDSGIPWLPVIPECWKTQRFGSTFKLKPAINDPTKELLSVFLDRGVIKAVESEKRTHAASEDLSKYQVVNPSDFVMNNQQAWRGSVGVSQYEGIISPAYHIFTLPICYSPKFANYLLRDKVMVNLFDISSKGVGSIQRTLNFNWLNSGKCIIPPKDEQEKIVAFLDAKTLKIDECICLRERELQTLNELKQSQIASVVTRGLNPNVPMKDSGIPWIGQIPAHWETRRIKWLFVEEDEKNTELNYQLLTFSRKKGIIPFSDANEKEASASDLTKYKVLHPGQLLENRMQAWSGMFGCSHIEGCVSPDYSVFSRRTDKVNVEYFAFLFRTALYIQQFANASKGIGDGFNRLYTPQFFKIYAIVPPFEEQNKIVEYINNQELKIDSMISSLNAEIERLKEYKQSLISDVVTGQINVQDEII